MQLTTRRVKLSDKDIKRIYFAAFPKKERMPFPMMTAMSKLWNTAFLGFYDDGAACGFVYLAKGRKLVFIMFLAVDEGMRSSGYGSAILREVKARYPDKKLVVSIEPCEDGAPDIELRKKRKAFYMKNGYEETGCMMKLNGVVQEVLVSNGAFAKKELRGFLARYSNGVLWPRIWKAEEQADDQ